MKLFGKLMEESVQDNAGNISSTRVQSYHVLRIIYIFAIFVLASEIFHMVKSGSIQLSSQFMIAFGGFLTHHLALLGINKNSSSEPKFMPEFNRASEIGHIESGDSKTLLKEDVEKKKDDIDIKSGEENF